VEIGVRDELKSTCMASENGANSLFKVVYEANVHYPG
jgi:hypothetical protein